MHVTALDFDGVVRLWPGPGFMTELEVRYRQAPGSLREALHADGLESDVVHGRVFRAQWRGILRRRVGTALADEWCDRPSRVDLRVVALVRTARAAGQRVVLLTNGTDETQADLRRLGLATVFATVYNSAEIGAAKPEIAAFIHVANAEGVPPDRLVLVDDTAENVSGAERAGWRGVRYDGPASLRGILTTGRGAD